MSASRPAPTAGRRTRPQVSMSCVPCCADEARRICATSNDGERATMEFESVIRGRRSIRAYTNEAVPVDLVREILDEARWAPSWRNTQAWNVWAVSGGAPQRYKQEFKACLLYTSDAADDLLCV